MRSIKILHLTALVAALGVLAGCATQPSVLAASDTKADAPLGQCTLVTGSRIRPRNGDCVPTGARVKSYSAEQLQATGEMDLVEALRQMDPAFQ